MYRVFLRRLVTFCSIFAGGFLAVAIFVGLGTYFRDAERCSFGHFASKCDLIGILEWGLVGGIAMAAVSLSAYFIIVILTFMTRLIRRLMVVIHK